MMVKFRAVFYRHTYNEEGGGGKCFLCKFYNEEGGEATAFSRQILQ